MVKTAENLNSVLQVVVVVVVVPPPPAAVDSTTLEMLHSYSCNKITMTVRNRENNAFPCLNVTNINILK